MLFPTRRPAYTDKCRSSLAKLGSDDGDGVPGTTLGTTPQRDDDVLYIYDSSHHETVPWLDIL